LKLTTTGKRIVLATLFTLILTVALSDIPLLVLTLVLLSASVSDLLLLRGRIKQLRRVKAEPSQINVRMIAGESRELRLSLNPPAVGDVELENPEKWVKIVGEPYSEYALVKVEVNPQTSGEYSLKGLHCQVLGPLKLFRAKVEIPFNLQVKAYPRFLAWIVEVARFIEYGGEHGPGGLPGKRKGLGLEYLETREYYPGDPLRFIDWKATARLSKLMVKEFYEDVYGSAHLIYDVRSLGPVTSDKLASLFLSAALNLAYAGLPVTLTIKSGSKIIFEAEKMNPIEALKTALAHVMETYHISEWDIYEVCEPKPSRSLLKTLKAARAEGLAKLLEFKLKNLQGTPIIKQIRQSSQKLDITYICSIVHEAATLIEISDEAALKQHRLRILTPAKPWIDAKNLEEAYTFYISYQKTFTALQKHLTTTIIIC
jgi:uncharacterized protein (DUF58 family)